EPGRRNSRPLNKFSKINFCYNLPTMSSASKLDLSIVITSHREGIVAHKTILSIFRALEPFDKEHIPYEIIIHIDSGDEPTRAYYERYKKDRRFRIFENSYRDPAKSRNFAI